MATETRPALEMLQSVRDTLTETLCVERDVALSIIAEHCPWLLNDAVGEANGEE